MRFKAWRLALLAAALAAASVRSCWAIQDNARGPDPGKVNVAGDTMTGSLVLASPSTLTVSGNAFSVGGTTFVVSGGRVGVNTANPGTLLHISSGVLTIDGTASGANFGANAPVTISSAAFVGLTVSTQAAGGAGASVTALCPANKFAVGGGCNCTGGVSVTGTISEPNCVTAGCVASGWTCQEPGGTGGACAARVLCSRLQ